MPKGKGIACTFRAFECLIGHCQNNFLYYNEHFLCIKFLKLIHIYFEASITKFISKNLANMI